MIDPDSAAMMSPCLITVEELQDFYLSKGVKMFPNTGRELEVDEEPEALYRYHQMDTNSCIEAGNKYIFLIYI